MASGDVVIASSATEAAPHEYAVKDAEWFAVKQVQALYEDNGAGGAWLPALEIIAPGGIVTGRYVGSSVAAGSDQEVTFHPLGRGVSSATPSTAATDFGPSSWYVPLINFHGAAEIIVTSGVDFVYDSAATSGGYMTRATPQQNAYFAILMALHPQNSQWGFTFTFYGGSDYGVISVDIASLLYQSSLRPVGNPAGTIQDVTVGFGNALVAGYGANPVFKNLVTLDAYNATPLTESNYNGTITFVPGGAEGAVLTNLSASTDPYTGFSISDGGPGWYVLRFKVTSKNAASTNYRFRIPMVSVLRLADGEGF